MLVVNHLEIATVLSLAGVALISIGAGGVGPSVAAFGGDQIDLTLENCERKEELFLRYFSTMHFFISLGIFASSWASPWIRTAFSYPVAFGVTTVVVLLAALVFWAGRSTYLHVEPSDSAVAKVFGIILYGIFSERVVLTEKGRRDSIDVERELRVSQSVKEEPCVSPPPEQNFRSSLSSSSRNGHWTFPWLEKSKNVYHSSDVEDTKKLLRLFLIFIPTSVFWSLFDQQSSTWVFQAQLLQRNISGWNVYADQMQVRFTHLTFFSCFFLLFSNINHPVLLGKALFCSFSLVLLFYWLISSIIPSHHISHVIPPLPPIYLYFSVAFPLLSLPLSVILFLCISSSPFMAHLFLPFPLISSFPS